MSLIYQPTTVPEKHQSLFTLLPQTEHCTRIPFEYNNGHSSSISRRKKIAIFGGIFLVLISIVACFCVFTLKKEQNFQTQCDVTIAAMNTTMNIYCSHLPGLVAENCDQFATGFLATIDPPLPQVTLQHQINIHDKKTRTEFFVNVITTVEKYILLVDQVKKEEHGILCHSFMVAGIKCNPTEFCSDRISSTSFYCGLQLTHNYLWQLKMFLLKKISDLPMPITSLDDSPSFWKESLSVFRHWYTIAVLKEATTQVETIRNVVESSKI